MPKGKGRQTGLEVLLQKALLLQVFFTCKYALLSRLFMACRQLMPLCGMNCALIELEHRPCLITRS